MNSTQLHPFICVSIFLLLSYFEVRAQSVLKPGFDPNEYAELLRITARQRGEIPDSLFPKPLQFDLAYQSDSIGMDNGWQLWKSKDEDKKVAVISIRATTLKQVSWLENLYCPMVDATGELQIEDDFKFTYNLSSTKNSAVHLGWLIGTAYIQRDVLPQLEKAIDEGIKDFYIFGHSQGGAISYLLTSHFYYLQQDGKIPSDVRFKTYGSAAPKPGNIEYAYDYETITLGGWAYNVVSNQDWVPEAPLSIQTLEDYPQSNPFIHIKEGTQGLKFIQRLVVRGKLNSIKRKLEKSSKQMNKIMGKQLTSLVKQTLPDYEPPKTFDNTNNYQRAGYQIALVAEDEYFDFLPSEQKDNFRNHMMDAYQLLLEVYYGGLLREEYTIYTNEAFPFYEHPTIPKPKKDKPNDESKE